MRWSSRNPTTSTIIRWPSRDRSSQISPTPAQLKRRASAAGDDERDGDEALLTLGEVPAVGPRDVVEWKQDGVQHFVFSKLRGGQYPVEGTLVAGGARPLIYATFMAVVDPDDPVLYPVPSWNNHHYSQLSRARGIPLSVSADTMN